MSMPVISRTFDPAFLNRVANDPAVRPSLGGEGELDLSELVSDPAGFALVTDEGGFVLQPRGPGHYEVHSLFLPGSAAVPTMRAAQEWMFTRTDCTSIWSKVPDSNKAAKGLARAGGLRSIFKRDDARLGDTSFVELNVMSWAMNNPALAKRGERFHNLLEKAKKERGSELHVHPHDEAHERAVGAAWLMIENGQAAKGVGFYNLWAGVAGYQTIQLLSLAPVTVDAGDAVLGLGQNGVEVVLCR